MKPATSKAQRTDTVLKAPQYNSFVVIDAKYYGASDVQSAPGWGDIVKLFFYAKALKVYAQNAEVGNAFVFPGSGPFHSVHMIERGEKGAILDEDYPPIRCFYLDPMELIECYTTGQKLIELSRSLMSLAYDEQQATGNRQQATGNSELSCFFNGLNKLFKVT